MTVFVVPSSEGVVRTLLQFTVAKPLVFCCNVKPGEGDGEVTATVSVVVRETVSEGGIALEYLMVTKSQKPLMPSDPPVTNTLQLSSTAMALG